jgi:hypothetical protein
MNTNLETDAFLTAVRDVLIGGSIPELAAKNVVEWHHGESDPLEDTGKGNALIKGVAVILYDNGGTEDDANADMISAEASVELFVDTTKRRGSELRKGGEIRDAIMRLLHRHSSLRNTAAFADCRVSGYQVIADPDFAAWRITLTRRIYLILD